VWTSRFSTGLRCLVGLAWTSTWRAHGTARLKIGEPRAELRQTDNFARGTKGLETETGWARGGAFWPAPWASWMPKGCGGAF